MGYSPKSYLAWSIDLGNIHEDHYNDPKFEGLLGSLVDEDGEPTVDNYGYEVGVDELIDKALEGNELVGHYSYSYEYSSHFLAIARSYNSAWNWSSSRVDPASLVEPTQEEREALLHAAHEIGVAATPEDIALILYTSYS